MTLVIETITGKIMEFEGKVTVKNTPEGMVYYVAGQSFPAEIVKELRSE